MLSHPAPTVPMDQIVFESARDLLHHGVQVVQAGAWPYGATHHGGLLILARTSASNINWGNDSSQWARDGECDDPRFEGPSMAETLLEEDRLRDATDCRQAYMNGDISLRGEGSGNLGSGFRWGDNSSQWANDDECDDPRFTGPGADETMLDVDMYRDANDCRSLHNQGLVWLKPTSSSGSGGIEWGDNTSRWANDGECDDPRFAGPNIAKTLLDEDRFHDANDCRAAYQAGQLYLR